MAELIHNNGLELPVFPRWRRVAWSSQDIRNRANSGPEKILRRVTLQYTGATSLRGALEVADTTMNRMAEYAGIEVIEHTWGLTKRRPSRRARKYDKWRLKSNYVPEGYQLVAEVPNLAPLIELDQATRDALSELLNSYHDDVDIPGPWITQIHTGAIAFHRAEKLGPLVATILDIDPFLQQTKPRTFYEHLDSI